jgi:hypothetical protein
MTEAQFKARIRKLAVVILTSATFVLVAAGIVFTWYLIIHYSN